MKKYLVYLALALALAGAFAPVAAGQSLRYFFPWKVLVFGIEPGSRYIISDISFDTSDSGTAVIVTPAGAELVPFMSSWSGSGLVSLYLMKKLSSDADNERAFPLLYPSLSDRYPNLYPDYEKERLGDIEKEEANTLAAMKVAHMLNTAAMLDESMKKAGLGIARLPAVCSEFYTEPQLIELLTKIFAWPAYEKLVFITADGQTFIFGGGEPNEVTIKFRYLIKTLARKGQDLGTVTNIVHNHKRGFDFSPADFILHEQFRKLGFTGEFQIFYPQTGKIKTLKRKE